MTITITAANLTAYLVEGLRRRFLKDGNPLHVWHAYQLIRRRQVPTLDTNGELALMAGEPLPMPEWSPRISTTALRRSSLVHHRITR